MDLNVLEAKLAELEKQYTQVLANGYALNGAIQFCKHLMEEARPKPATSTANPAIDGLLE